MGIPTIAVDELPPRSIFDIISFAFHRLGRQWRLIAFLAVPIVLICALLEALTIDSGLDLPLLQKDQPEWYEFLKPETARYSAHMVISLLALWGGGWFLNYLYLRTIVLDLTGATLDRTLKLFLPDSTFWGYLGVSLIQSLTMVSIGGIAAIGIVAMIGAMALFSSNVIVILLLVLISMALSVVFAIGTGIIWIRLFLASTFYFLEPHQGILQAFRTTWVHSKNNWWRTLGFILFLGILLQIMLSPLLIIHMMVGTFTGSDLPGFKILEPGLLRTVILILEQILWLSGAFMITLSVTAYAKARFAIDVIARRLQLQAKRASQGPTGTPA